MAKKKESEFHENLARYSELVQKRAVYKDMLQRIQSDFLTTDTQKTVKQLQAIDGEFNITVTQEVLESVVGELEKRIQELFEEIGELA
jgi:multidrug resistance efflux pump